MESERRVENEVKLQFEDSCRSLLLPFFLFFLSNLAAAVDDCEKTCGNFTAPYPFGFSGGCPILFACSNPTTSSFQIGEFQVRNLTGDSLFVDVPDSCTRPIDAADSRLFSDNFAMTARTGLLLRNCTGRPRSDGCRVNSVFFNDQCVPRLNNATCFSNKSDGRFLIRDSVKASGCSILFTAVVDNGAWMTSLVLRLAELEWWLNGKCQCSTNADCTVVKSPMNGRPGFRCRCYDGFEGDGFLDGRGCRKVPSKQKCRPTNYIKGDCDETSSKIRILLGGIIAGASTVTAVALVWYFIRRRALQLRKRQSMRRMLSELSGTVPLYLYKDIEKATDGFSDARLLGTGAFGTVYVGTFSNHRQVAVKKIKNSIEQVMNEIMIMSSVCHPNLVQLLGCCVEQDEQILIYEYMPHGTLAQHLQRKRGPPLPWTMRLAIAADTASAIAYLHSVVYPPIYHRDIKSSNILLDHYYNSKVADFGLSRTGLQAEAISHISTAPQGTPGYVDPQYHQNFHLSDKSDVYSFGVVLAEIITGMKAMDFSRPQSEVNLAMLAADRIGRGCVDEIVDPCLDLHCDAWTFASIHKVAEIAFRCLSYDRNMRPTMTEVADELVQIKLSGCAPAAEEAIVMSTVSSFSSP